MVADKVMNRFSIKDLENLTGIKAHTIRIWEQRYGILQPKRTATNIRYYDADDLKMALRVSLLNAFGYKISRINKMTDEDMAGLIQKISDGSFRLQAIVNELLEAALAMDTVRFEALLDAQIKKRGLESTIEEICFLFLEKIGIMWMTNRLIPAQEHLASNVIYRKMAVAIEGLTPPAPDAATILLFLPEGEIHEISLMYVQYLLRRAGHRVMYLGANTPLSEAATIYNACRPDYVYLHLTSVADDFEGQRFFRQLAVALPGAEAFISGPVLSRGRYKAPEGMRFLYSLTEVRDAMLALSAPERKEA